MKRYAYTEGGVGGEGREEGLPPPPPGSRAAVVPNAYLERNPGALAWSAVYARRESRANTPFNPPSFFWP